MAQELGKSEPCMRYGEAKGLHWASTYSLACFIE